MSVEQRVVFGSGFDALFTTELRQRVSPAVAQELAALGVRLDRPFNAAYPIETWLACVELVCRRIYPELPMGAAQRQLGRMTMDGFGHTLVGKALFGMLRLIGPVRAVERASRNYASTNNYTKVVLTRTGPSAFDFYLNEKHTLPDFDMGVVEAMLEYLGAKDRKVTLVNQDAEGFTMHLEWTP